MKKILAGTVVVLGFSGQTFAADIAARPFIKAPVMTPAYNWTGFYLGAGGGYGAYLSEQRTFAINGLPINDPASNGGGKGWFGTVVAGYDVQFADRFVAGIFADYDFSDIKGQNINFSGGSVSPRGLNSAWSVGGRLGFLASPATLLYVTGGYTHGEFLGGPSQFIATNLSSIGGETGTNQGGTFFGAGVETMLWQNVSGRLEYRHASYDVARGTRYDLLGVTQGFTDTKPSVQTIRATLAYKFGTPGIGATYSPPPLPASTWTGFYVGGGGGYGIYEMNAQYPALNPAFQSRPWTNSGNGVLATITGGYDIQFAGRWVAGIFADYDFAHASGTADLYSALQDSGFKGNLRQNSAWAVGGRLGYLVSPQTMLYATGGYTEAHFETATFAKDSGGIPTNPVLPGQTFGGWFAGIGTEARLVSNWYARLEYRYAEYDSHAAQIPLPPGPLIDRGEFKPSIQTVRAGLTYKFGGPGLY